MKIKIGRPKKNRKVRISIHDYDLWSMDTTLALIIATMLRALKEAKQGSPYVEDEDVPENIQTTSATPTENEYDVDEFHHNRWDWVLDEMIWTFTSIANVDDQLSKQKQMRLDNGLRLFGRYYQNLWD